MAYFTWRVREIPSTSSVRHELRCRALLVSYNVEPNDSTQLRGR